MPKNSKYSEQLYVNINKQLNSQLKAQAKKRNISKSELVREYLWKCIAEENAIDGMDKITDSVRNVIRAELKRSENRLADLVAKDVITSATTQELVLDMIKLRIPDKEEARLFANGRYQRGRKMAVAYIRQPLNEILNDKE